MAAPKAAVASLTSCGGSIWSGNTDAGAATHFGYYDWRHRPIVSSHRTLMEG